MIKKLLILIFFISYSKTSFSNQVEVNKYLDGMFSYSSMVSYKSKDSFLLFGRHSGIVKLILNGVLVSENFIDLRDRALLGGENKGHSFEEGIQDIAFSNNYSNENRVYISYTDKFHNLTLSRFELSKNLLKGISGTEEVLLNVEKHRREHASGALDFSPIDNYLYIGIGDGDIDGNPSGTSQNKRALQGKILRIDVVKSKKEFSIPSDNPFLNTDSRPELWAYGLRSLIINYERIHSVNGINYENVLGIESMENMNNNFVKLNLKDDISECIVTEDLKAFNDGTALFVRTNQDVKQQGINKKGYFVVDAVPIGLSTRSSLKKKVDLYEFGSQFKNELNNNGFTKEEIKYVSQRSNALIRSLKVNHNFYKNIPTI